VSLQLSRGEVLGFVGESGAGKSLTGLAVLGLLPPSGYIASGTIMFDGVRLDRLPAHAWQSIRGRRIAAIFQDPLTALNPMFTVGDQVAETMQLHLGLDRARAKATAVDWLERVGITPARERAAQYPHQFSGGMRQRVVIALALCARPELVIADEPTTALDASVQGQVLDLLQSLCREQGVAVILVSHDLGVVSRMAHRIAVLYAGRVVETGPAAEVIGAPRHPYTQGLLGAIPRMGSRVPRLVQIPGAMPPPAARPHGCAFKARCVVAVSACAEAPPVLLGSRHQVACFRSELLNAVA